MIHLVTGPMFSGKTEELLRLTRRHVRSGRTCFLITYANDNRYSDDDVITSHDKNTMSARKCLSLDSVLEEACQYDVISIDEGQFFEGLPDFCEMLASKGKHVIIAALDATFERKPFKNVINLLPLTEKITKLSAICDLCKNEGHFTFRLSNATQEELIGGSGDYIPLCRKCFYMSVKSLKLP
jgi:thymidine kinase